MDKLNNMKDVEEKAALKKPQSANEDLGIIKEVISEGLPTMVLEH